MSSNRPIRLLDPARRVIEKAGAATGRPGIEVIAGVARKHPSRVYRWMREKSVGGTGGLIPSRAQTEILEWSVREKIGIVPEDFFGSSQAAA